MKFAQITAMAVSLILFAGPINAYAGEFYLAAGVGNATLDDDFDGLRVNDNSTAIRITAGWSFNDYFSLEGGYNDFGDFEQSFADVSGPSTARLSADGFIMGATGSIPVGERFALTGRAGMFFWNGSAEVNNVSQATPEDSNLYLGAGVSFDLSKSFQLTGDWTRYELESAASSVFSLGFQYRFR
jgi:hypothetical protein